MTRVATIVAITGGLVGIATGLVAAIIAVLKYRQDRKSETRKESDSEQLLAETVGKLAYAVRVKWHDEEERRRIHDPFPLSVRWVNSVEGLFDHWPNITKMRTTVSSGKLNLAGCLDKIVDIYDRVPSRRLVVLGSAGSGKTILALRFVLDLLDRRSAGDAVPVVVSVSSWNPFIESLREWLAARLIEEHPGLGASTQRGYSLAASLIDHGLILPVLDGLDEMAISLRAAALTALNLSTAPMLLTSRPVEYAAAVDAADVLTAAAAVTIVDLAIDDLADYLPLTTRKTDVHQGQAVTKWDPVIARLRQEPDMLEVVVVRSVLSTPLMVGLARVIYSDVKESDPAELFDIDRFPTPEALEDHLLDAFIPAAYKYSPRDTAAWRRHEWAAEDAERWLVNLAIHLRVLGTRDLAWWQLRDTVPRPVRILVGGLVAGLGAGALLGLVWNFWVGFGLGLGFGAAVAAAHESRQPIRTRPGAHGRGRDVAATIVGSIPGGVAGALLGASVGGVNGLAPKAFSASRTGALLNPLLGIAVGLAAGLGFAVAGRFAPGSGGTRVSVGELGGRDWIMRLLKGCVLGAVAGLLGGVALGIAGGLVVAIACALSVGLVIGLETAVDVRTVATPIEVLRTDRHNALFMLILFGLTVWLAVSLASWSAMPHTRSLAFGLGSGLMDGLGFCLGFTAWGHWCIITRGWLPMTRRLPLAIIAFLADAHERGVLRQAGAVYQFRHARLQDRLVERTARHVEIVSHASLMSAPRE